jgi:CRP/FNR family transcriptional regulator, cyclic AMP receptor protein
MSDAATVEFLATVPLLDNQDEADLAELRAMLRRRQLKKGEVLWHQGEESREMVFIVDGGVAATLQVPGDRDVEIARSGPGEMLGELALLDGGAHTMRVGATERATVLVLNRTDFAALLARRAPSAFRLKRRLASLFVQRHREQLERLASSLSDEPAGPPPSETQKLAELEQCGPPDSRYLRRMATFHDFDSLALWSFLTSGTYVRCPAGRTLLAEGAPSGALYLTINGAVEKLVIRGDRRIRIRLAGPGKAFGYESLIDGQPSPVTAITRERALLLVLPRDPFDQLFNREDAVSRVFLDVIQRDLVATLRDTLRPHARLAASL